MVLIAVCLATIFLSANLSMYSAPQQYGEFNVHFTFHCTVAQYRNGELLSVSYHPMTITDYGEEQLEALIANQSTYGLIYFGCSNDSGSVDSEWTVLPDEIITDGLERAASTYVNVGTGTWNMTYTWTASGENSTKLYGIYSESSGSNLCVAEQQGEVNQKDLGAGDTLTMTVEGSLS